MFYIKNNIKLKSKENPKAVKGEEYDYSYT